MTARTEGPQPFRIAADTTRQRIFIAIGAVVAVASLFILVTSVGSACAIIFMRMLPEHRWALEVDERGITDNSSSAAPGLIPWDDIAAVYDWQVRQGHTLAIDLKDPEGLQGRMAPHPAANVRARLAQGIPAVEIRVAAFPGSYTVGEVLDAARAYRPKAVKQPRRWKAPKKR